MLKINIKDKKTSQKANCHLIVSQGVVPSQCSSIGTMQCWYIYLSTFSRYLYFDISIICFFIFALYITTIRQCPLSRCDL